MVQLRNADFACVGPHREIHRGENRIIRFELTDETAIAVKIYRQRGWSREALEEEHTFIGDLERAGLCVATPLPLAGGSTIGSCGGSYFAVSRWIDGVDLTDQELADSHIEQLGTLAATLHAVGRCRQARFRRSMEAIDFCRGATEFLLSGPFVPDAIRSEFIDVASAIVDVLDAHDAPGEHGRIHGDLGLWNILWREAGPVVIDFDDMGPGPPIQDLAQLALGIVGNRQHVLDRLADGYGASAMSDLTSMRCDAVLAARRVHVSAWIASRWSDPAFRRRYPAFRTVSRWRRELATMWHLLGRSEPGASTQPGKEPS